MRVIIRHLDAILAFVAAALLFASRYVELPLASDVFLFAAISALVGLAIGQYSLRSDLGAVTRVSEDSRDTISKIDSLLSAKGSAEARPQEEFYRSMRLLIAQASSEILLVHHEPFPPDIRPDPRHEISEYFHTLDNVISKNTVPVRRIVTIPNPEKLNWVVSEMLRKHKKDDNFDVRLSNLLEFEGDKLVRVHEEEMVPLSIQIVDRRYVYIVNIGSGFHTSFPGSDLFLDSPSAAEYFRTYFEKYWAVCDELKRGTQVFEDRVEAVRRRFEPQ